MCSASFSVDESPRRLFMITTPSRISRRAVLGGAATLVASTALPVRAQAPPIKLGTLTPLTGAGGSYGPSMRKAMEYVAGEINGAGGVLGRQIQLVSEDD